MNFKAEAFQQRTVLISITAQYRDWITTIRQMLALYHIDTSDGGFCHRCIESQNMSVRFSFAFFFLHLSSSTAHAEWYWQFLNFDLQMYPNGKVMGERVKAHAFEFLLLFFPRKNYKNSRKKSKRKETKWSVWNMVNMCHWKQTNKRYSFLRWST